jgi:hypothetical protein
MIKQITKKLDHEKGKLRDKGSNADYRERFREESGRFDRGGTHGNRIVLADSFGAALRKIITQNKETAALLLESKLRSLPLKVDSYVFNFKSKPPPLPKPTMCRSLPLRNCCPTC